MVPSDPIWTPQEINLNAYAGKQITLRFDYTYDTSGFFNDVTHRAALEKAPLTAKQLAGLKKDPAFAKMAENPKYKDVFVTK